MKTNRAIIVLLIIISVLLVIIAAGPFINLLALKDRKEDFYYVRYVGSMEERSMLLDVRSGELWLYDWHDGSVEHYTRFYGLGKPLDNSRPLPQKEAQINLENVFAVQIALFGEMNKFGTNFKEVYWRPEGRTHYAYFLPEETLQPDVGGPYELPEGIRPEVSEKSFVMVAAGNLDDDPTLDIWTINEHKELKHLVNDLGEW